VAKAIQITDEAYNELVAGRKLAIQKAEKEGDKECVGALKAMGIGGFAGWLIFKGLKELGVETVGDIVLERRINMEEPMVKSMVYLGNGIAALGDDDSGSISLSIDYGVTWESRHFDPDAWINLSKNLGKESLSVEGNNLLREILAEAGRIKAKQ